MTRGRELGTVLFFLLLLLLCVGVGVTAFTNGSCALLVGLLGNVVVGAAWWLAPAGGPRVAGLAVKDGAVNRSSDEL